MGNESSHPVASMLYGKKTERYVNKMPDGSIRYITVKNGHVIHHVVPAPRPKDIEEGAGEEGEIKEGR